MKTVDEFLQSLKECDLDGFYGYEINEEQQDFIHKWIEENIDGYVLLYNKICYYDNILFLNKLEWSKEGSEFTYSLDNIYYNTDEPNIKRSVVKF